MKKSAVVSGLRRKFFASAAALTAAAALPARAKATEPEFTWNMAMTWQKTLPGLGTGAVRLADRIEKLSGGAMKIEVYSAGELVPAFGLFDAVSSGSVQMGHSACYYWQNKNRAASFFTAIPGGMTAEEQNAWLYFGGGLPLWHEMYAPFNLIAFPAGNTGTQAGGWFNKEINSPEDVKGLKMRIPGLAGEVFGRIGGSPVLLPAQELYTAMESGTIDAMEWVGPWNDVSMGLHKVAKYYYAPGLHEGGGILECMINKDAYNSLPEHLQLVIKTACAVENLLMRAEYQARNAEFMEILRREHGIEPRPFPDSFSQAFFKASAEAVADIAAAGGFEKRVADSYLAYMEKQRGYAPFSEYGYIKAREAAGA